MKRFWNVILIGLLAGVVGSLFSGRGWAAEGILDLLVIGPIESGDGGCGGITMRRERIRQSYIRRIEKQSKRIRPLPENRMKTALQGFLPEFSALAANEFRMAREVGRRAKADLVLIVDHEFKRSIFGGGVCHLTLRLMDPIGSGAPFSFSIETHKNARKKNNRKFSHALTELFLNKGRNLIQQAIARKGGDRPSVQVAGRSPGGLPKLLFIGPMDGNLNYHITSDDLRSSVVERIIPKVMGKFDIISGSARHSPLQNMPDAKGIDFGHHFYFSRLVKDDYRLARKFGKAHGADFVAIVARDSERSLNGGQVYVSFIDLEGRGFSGKDTRGGGGSNIESTLQNFFKEFAIRSRKGIDRAIARRSGQKEEVQVALLTESERRRREAAEKRQDAQDNAELDRLRRERELARLEIETLRKERARMAAERKKLEDLRESQPVGGGKTVADLRRMQPAAIFLRQPREGESTENPTVRLNAAVTSVTDIRKIEVFLNGVHQFKIGERDLKGDKSRAYELSNFIRGNLGKNELKVVATTMRGVRSERVVRFTRKRPVGNIYAVVIGVNKYKNVPPLRYAVGDAKAFSNYLTGHLGVPKKNVTMLLDENVTLRSLRTTLGVTLRKAAGPKDTVLIYYAGHGGTEPDDLDRDGDGLEKYLLPHDADPDALFGTAMSMGGLQSVFRRIRSDRLIFIADACYSGAAGGRTIMSSRRATVSDKFMNRLSKGKGRIVLSAAGANQVAQEDVKLGHGVFTYYLIEALKGAGDKDGDGYVSVDEAYDYVSKTVPKATGHAQTPVRKGSSVGQLYIGRVQKN